MWLSMMSDIWQQFLHLIREECGSRVVETWFKAITFCSWDAALKTVFLQAPNTFVKEWVVKNYLSLIQLHLGRLLHVDMPRIMFEHIIPATVLPSMNTSVAVVAADTTKIVPARVLPFNNRLNRVALKEQHDGYSYHIDPQYQFENFIVGPSNSLAYAAAHAVAESPGTLYNPLFIYSESGLGKSHLLRAIGNAVRQRSKDAVVLYQSADRFVTEFINAIRFKKVHKFKEKYHHIDILLIDDIHFISNKEQTQEAFFHIFNSLYDARKQIVFSSDTFPQNMQGIAERLQSRLTAGLVTDMHAPSVETKIAIVKQKALAQGHEINDDVAYYIAVQVVANVRELEGTLVRVIAFASLTQQRVSLELARQVLNRGQSTPQEAVKNNELDGVLRIVASNYLCKPDDLYTKSRSQEHVQARHVAMFLIKQLTGKSLRAIGDFLGGRDHSTVVHAVDKVTHEMKLQPQFRLRVEQIEKEIRSKVFEHKYYV
jgi:chromosomal replication initiator protein